MSVDTGIGTEDGNEVEEWNGKVIYTVDKISFNFLQVSMKMRTQGILRMKIVKMEAVLMVREFTQLIKPLLISYRYH